MSHCTCTIAEQNKVGTAWDGLRFQDGVCDWNVVLPSQRHLKSLPPWIYTRLCHFKKVRSTLSSVGSYSAEELQQAFVALYLLTKNLFQYPLASSSRHTATWPHVSQQVKLFENKTIFPVSEVGGVQVRDTRCCHWSPVRRITTGNCGKLQDVCDSESRSRKESKRKVKNIKAGPAKENNR